MRDTIIKQNTGTGKYNIHVRTLGLPTVNYTGDFSTSIQRLILQKDTGYYRTNQQKFKEDYYPFGLTCRQGKVVITKCTTSMGKSDIEYTINYETNSKSPNPNGRKTFYVDLPLMRNRVCPILSSGYPTLIFNEESNSYKIETTQPQPLTPDELSKHYTRNIFRVGSDLLEDVLTGPAKLPSSQQYLKPLAAQNLKNIAYAKDSGIMTDSTLGCEGKGYADNLEYEASPWEAFICTSSTQTPRATVAMCGPDGKMHALSFVKEYFPNAVTSFEVDQSQTYQCYAPDSLWINYKHFANKQGITEDQMYLDSSIYPAIKDVNIRVTSCKKDNTPTKPSCDVNLMFDSHTIEALISTEEELSNLQSITQHPVVKNAQIGDTARTTKIISTKSFPNFKFDKCLLKDGSHTSTAHNKDSASHTTKSATSTTSQAVTSTTSTTSQAVTSTTSTTSQAAIPDELAESMKNIVPQIDKSGNSPSIQTTAGLTTQTSSKKYPTLPATQNPKDTNHLKELTTSTDADVTTSAKDTDYTKSLSYDAKPWTAYICTSPTQTPRATVAVCIPNGKMYVSPFITEHFPSAKIHFKLGQPQAYQCYAPNPLQIDHNYFANKQGVTEDQMYPDSSTYPTTAVTSYVPVTNCKIDSFHTPCTISLNFDNHTIESLVSEKEALNTLQPIIQDPIVKNAQIGDTVKTQDIMDQRIFKETIKYQCNNHSIAISTTNRIDNTNKTDSVLATLTPAIILSLSLVATFIAGMAIYIHRTVGCSNFLRNSRSQTTTQEKEEINLPTARSRTPKEEKKDESRDEDVEQGNPRTPISNRFHERLHWELIRGAPGKQKRKMRVELEIWSEEAEPMNQDTEKECTHR